MSRPDATGNRSWHTHRIAARLGASLGLGRVCSVWLVLTALVLAARADIVVVDSAGNEMAGGTFSSGETYIYNPNSAPTAIALSPDAIVAQSAGASAVVGALVSTDADSADTHTYTLVSGTGDTDNAFFSISGTNLVAGNAATMAAGAYSVRVRTDDGHDGTFEQALTVTVADDVVPTLVSVGVPTNGLYSAYRILAFTLTFSEPVVVSNTPSLALTVGSSTVTGSYTSGSGTSNLVFWAWLETGREDLDGIELTSVVTNSATIADAAGNAAGLDLSVAPSLAGVLVDAVLPQIDSIVRKAPAQSVVETNRVVFTVTFSESVTGVTTNWFKAVPANGSSVDASVVSITGSGSEYDVVVEILSGSGGLNLALDAFRATTTPYLTGFNGPTGLTRDTAGNLYVASINAGTISKVDTNGLISSFATNVPGVFALAFDSQGNLFATSLGFGSGGGLFKIDTNGAASLYAGFTNVQVAGLAIDSADNVFVSSFLDPSNGTIFRVDTNGVVSEFATNISMVVALAFDSHDNLFASVNPAGIARVSTNGTLTAFSPVGMASYGMVFDDEDNLYVADFMQSTVTRIDTNGVPTIVGMGMATPVGVVVDDEGGVLVSSYEAGQVVRPTGAVIADVAGNVLLTPTYTSDESFLYNHAPTDILLSFATVQQSGGVEAMVGALSGVDPDSGDTLTFQLTTNGSGSGSFDLIGTNLVAVNALTLAAGSYDVEISVEDQHGSSYAETFSVTVIDDIIPTGVADAYSLAEDGVLTVPAISGVLTNDSDVMNTNLTAVLVGGPSHGALTLNSNGSFTYTPTNHFHGSDSFGYVANDGITNSAPVTVSITVTSVNDLPVLTANEPLSLLPASSKPIRLAQINASDIESGAADLGFTLATVPAHGVLYLDAVPLETGDSFSLADVQSNLLVYAHGGDAAPVDGFSFVLSDGDGASLAATDFVIELARIERLSLNTGGAAANGASTNLSISADGRYLAFSSSATDLVAGDTNGVADIFVLDRHTGTIVLASASSAGAQGNGVSDWPRISANGRYVAFQSSANNLVTGDSNNKTDVFVRDLVNGTTQRASVSSAGVQANIDAINPAISGDGRYVVYQSSANNLVPGDTAGQTDIFIRDLVDQLTDRVSVSANGDQGDNASTFPSISQDGRYVAFQSNARNLVAVDTNNITDVFVHDRDSGTVELVSRSSGGAQGNNSSLFPSISDDGRFVAFQANANNLVAGDTNATTDVFLHDRQTDETIRVSVATDGTPGNGPSNEPRVSGDGHYVVFQSSANTLVAGDTNGVVDIFVYDRNSGRTLRVNLSDEGDQADGASSKPSVTVAGELVAFVSRASNLVPGANGLDQVYVAAFNDRPTISSIADVTVEEDNASPSIAFTVSDSLSEGDELEIAVVRGNDSVILADGVVLGGSGTNRTLVLNPIPNASGTVAITVRVSDGSLVAESAFQFTVTAVNDVPLAVDESHDVTEDTELVVSAPGVLSGDSDVDGDTLTVALGTGPAHGTLTLNPDGSFSYLPGTNYFGSDSFTYTVSDGTTNSALATVSLTVEAVNDLPTALAQSLGTAEDTAVAVTLSGADEDGDSLVFRVTTAPAHGVLSGTAPNLTYTPDAEFHGSDSFAYVANDGTSDGVPVTVSLAVTSVNDLPAAVAGTLSTDEDVALAITLSGTDADADTLTYTVTSAPAHGTLSGTAPNLTYLPGTNYFGADSFAFTVNDGTANSAAATVSLTINAVNDLPVGSAQSLAVDEDTSLPITLSGTDADGDTLTYTVASAPTHGTLSGTAPNLTYLPGTNYFGADSFTFTVNDGTGTGAATTVSLAVTAVNDLPTAIAQTLNVSEDGSLAVVLAGSDVDGDSLTYTVTGAPAHGTLSGTAPNLTYLPGTNYFGSDSFAFTVSDSAGSSPAATVSLTVDAINDLPIATGETYSTDEDTALVVAAPGLLANESDVDGDSLSAVVVANPGHGTLTLSANGGFTYLPATNYAGADSFTYKANDGTGDSGVVTVSLTVNAVNDAPIGLADSYSVDEDNSLVVAAAGVLANDSDVESSPITAVLAAGPAHGTLSLSPNGSFSYTPVENYTGADSFTYRANDGTANGGATTVTITVQPLPDAPIAYSDTYSVDEDMLLVVEAGGVLTNDFDVDDDVLSAVLVLGPSHGTLTLSTNGGFEYRPETNWFGSDSFTYLANDALIDSEPVEVFITVNSVNDPAASLADSYTTVEDNALTVVVGSGVLANDSDVEGSALQAVLSESPDHGTLVLNPNGSFTYTPTADFSGTDTFAYTANDGVENGAPTTVTITVSPVNDIPTVTAQTLTVDEDSSVEFTIAAFDADGDTLNRTPSALPQHGSNQGTEQNGVFIYRPAANFNGTDSFPVVAYDSVSQSVAVTFTVTVNPVNDAPLANDQTLSLNEDASLAVTLSGSDIDSDPLTYTVTVQPQHGVLSGTAPNLTYTPATNYHGADSFAFVANDGTTNSVAATVSLTVNAVNDVPAAVAQTLSTSEDTELAITLAGTDVDGDSLSYTVTVQPQHGVLSGTAPNLTYLPATNYHGADSFAFTVNDGTATSPAATVSLTVNPINDTPAAVAQTLGTSEDTALAVTLSGSDVDSDPLTYTVTLQPQHGVLSGTAPNLTYTPATNYHGADSFAFTVNDGTVDSPAATVALTVASVNDAPLASLPLVDQPATYGTAFNHVFAAGSFADADGDTLSYTAAGLPPGIAFDGAERKFSGTPTAAGEFTVTVVATDGQSPALSVTNAFEITVARAALTIAAEDKSRAFGAANPELTLAYTGFVNGDDASDLDTAPTVTTAATVGSAVGDYDITVTGAADANYAITFENGTLTVTAGDPPVITLAGTPLLYTVAGEPVFIDEAATVTDGGSTDFDGGFLTVAVATNGAAGDELTVVSEGNSAGQIGVVGSTIRFGNVPIGTFAAGTNALTELVFAFNTNATPAAVEALVQRLAFATESNTGNSRVLRLVVADGDGGVSEPAFRTVVLNHAPEATDDFLEVAADLSVPIPVEFLLENDTDVDGDEIALSAYSGVTANGGRVTLSGTTLTYRARAGFVGEDLFAYLIDDGRGGEAVGILTFRVYEQNRLVISVSAENDDAARMAMGGTPGRPYRIDYSTDLTTWTPLTTVTATAEGLVEILDIEARNQPQRFYRAVEQ